MILTIASVKTNTSKWEKVHVLLCYWSSDAWLLTEWAMIHKRAIINSTQFTSIIDWFGLGNVASSFAIYTTSLFICGASVLVSSDWSQVISFSLYLCLSILNQCIFHTCVHSTPTEDSLIELKGDEEIARKRHGGNEYRENEWKTQPTPDYWCTRIIQPSCLNYIKFTKFLYEILDWLNFIKCFTMLTETNFDVVFRSETAIFFVAFTAARTRIHIHTSQLTHSFTHIFTIPNFITQLSVS